MNNKKILNILEIAFNYKTVANIALLNKSFYATQNTRYHVKKCKMHERQAGQTFAKQLSNFQVNK